MKKTVHYCWFGRGEKPAFVQKCIASWKKHLPDYEIKEWNEDNFDLSDCKFASDAYKDRNFAFVSDYVRACVLYNEGGIYFDTDVEVLADFDRFLDDKFFAGFEEKAFVGTCVMGAEKGCPIFEEYIEHYKNADYFNADGTKYSDTNVVLLTRLLEEKGLVDKKYAPGSRKNINVTVNEKGRKLYRTYSGLILRHHFAPMFKHLQEIPEPYRKEIINALDRK